jgi:hypothetical protein
MSTPCTQTENIASIRRKVDDHEAEIYKGLDGRPAISTRIDRIERVVNKLVYVSTALLIAMLIGVGTVFFKVVAERSVQPITGVVK